MSTLRNYRINPFCDQVERLFPSSRNGLFDHLEGCSIVETHIGQTVILNIQIDLFSSCKSEKMITFEICLPWPRSGPGMASLVENKTPRFIRFRFVKQIITPSTRFLASQTEFRSDSEFHVDTKLDRTGPDPSYGKLYVYTMQKLFYGADQGQIGHPLM